MMKQICKYITQTLNLDYETYEVMYYGLFVCVTNTASILSVLLIGTVLGEFKNTIYFLIGFMPLRLFVGGYHASTPMKCYWYFNVVCTFFIVLFKNIDNTNILMPISLASLVLMFVQVRKYSDDHTHSVEMVLLIYMMAVILLKHFSWFYIILWSIILNVMLYELKILLKYNRSS